MIVPLRQKCSFHGVLCMVITISVIMHRVCRINIRRYASASMYRAYALEDCKTNARERGMKIMGKRERGMKIMGKKKKKKKS